MPIITITEELDLELQAAMDEEFRGERKAALRAAIAIREYLKARRADRPRNGGAVGDDPRPAEPEQGDGA